LEKKVKRIYAVKAPSHTLFSIDGTAYCVHDTHPAFEGINTELSAFVLPPCPAVTEMCDRLVNKVIENIDELLSECDECYDTVGVFAHPEADRIADIAASVEDELEDYDDYETTQQRDLDKSNRMVGHFEE
jgi:hypothetical protein